MAELPEDVVTDILTRLPVKSLLRFRCVSKPFRSLIDGPDFIKRHLNRSLLTKTNHKLVLRGFETEIAGPDARLYSVDLYTLDQIQELDHHFGTDIVGSDNGLLCLSNGEDIVLYNLATRDYQKVPATKIEFSGPPFEVNYEVIYGFGYDSVSDDYKVLKMVQLYEDDSDSFFTEAKVYGLRSNTWQRIQDFPYYHCSGEGEDHGELACGALHWVVSRKRHSDITPYIAAFHLATNEFMLVDHPKFLLKGPLSLVKLEERLCVMRFRSGERVDLWVMKDYGVKESWNKLFSVSQPGVVGSSAYLFPLVYSKSENEIMLVQGNTKLLWYNLKERTMKTINIRGFPHNFLVAEVCVESLVPLSGKAEDYAKKREAEEEKRKQIVMKRRDGFLSQGFKLKL